MSDFSLQELDVQFSELLPEREALGAFAHLSFHHCHPHHQPHHDVPRPCEPRPHPCPPPPPPCHHKIWLPFRPGRHYPW